jgi:hypothetical protein
MNLSILSGNRTLRIAMIVIGISLVVGLSAIFVFKVAPGSVLTFGLIGLFMASHLFMHGGHGGHDDHSQHTQSVDQTTDAVAQTNQKNKPTVHTGCH